ncbi:MAG: hypothetical protein O2867_05255 [Bacteroidetes bacterium]|nr:hypothetical protein [Bacteroidota bacterium]
MATKVPQEPKDHLARILCDADLDYLGGDDYDEIAGGLYQELFRTKSRLRIYEKGED